MFTPSQQLKNIILATLFIFLERRRGNTTYSGKIRYWRIYRQSRLLGISTVSVPVQGAPPPFGEEKSRLDRHRKQAAEAKGEVDNGDARASRRNPCVR
jgi:hypothetical protein